MTFQQMLTLCDQEGFVDMTADAIARRTTIPIEVITKGIAVLEQPDPESRRSEEEGRRIVLIDPNRTWGWQIVNYLHYRQIRSAQERRAYKREWMRKKRAAKGNGGDHEASDNSPIVESIPCTQGLDFDVRQALVDEYAKAYPSVDVPATLKEIRAWAVSNPSKRKTIKGASRFINSWLAREQNKPQ